MDRGVGATPSTTEGRRALRCGTLRRSRRLLAAGALTLVALIAGFADVGVAASGPRPARATAAESFSWSCDAEGKSGFTGLFKQIPPAPVSCDVPEHGIARCFPRDNEECEFTLKVTVDGPPGSDKHDLEAAGDLDGVPFHKMCYDATSCPAQHTIWTGCRLPFTAVASGYQYRKVWFFHREKDYVPISVHGELIERYVPLSQARLAHPAAAGCVPPEPLEVAVNGVATDDPLTGEPIASGYGNVSVSPPNATVRCPFVTDYRSCFSEWRLPWGAKVTLRAMPDPANGSYFVGWRGSGGSLNCPSSSQTCTVRAGQVSQITALFGAPIYKLTIDNTTNPSLGQVIPSGFSGLGPTFERIACGTGVNDCTAYYPLVDSTTMPNFLGPAPLSLGQNGIVTYDNEQWYIQFDSGCDAVRVVVDGSNRYTTCYYTMTADRTIKVDWTTTPP